MQAAATQTAEDLTELYRRYGPAIHRRALSLTRDAEEALDVTQDTFLAFMREQARPREASPFTVLYQITTFKAVDRLRRRARWSGRSPRLELTEEDIEAEARQVEVTSAHEGGLARVEAAQDLALLTRGEDPQTLTAAFLYFVEGHTAEEVAQVLSLSRKTVGKLLVRFAERARKRSARLEGGGQA